MRDDAKGLVCAAWLLGLVVCVSGHAGTARATTGCPDGVTGEWIGILPARSGERVTVWTEHAIVAGDETHGWTVIADGLSPDEVEARATDPTGRLAALPVSTAYAGHALLRADGSVEVLEVEVNTCGSSDRLDWVRRHRVRGTRVETAEYPSAFDVPTTFFRLGAYGWVYGHDWTHLYALTPRKSLRVRGWIIRSGDSPVEIAASETRTLALHGGELAELRGARATVLDRSAPTGIGGLAVDARGRAYGIAGGAVWRWSRRTRWERVLPSCAE